MDNETPQIRSFLKFWTSSHGRNKYKVPAKLALKMVGQTKFSKPLSKEDDLALNAEMYDEIFFN